MKHSEGSTHPSVHDVTADVLVLGAGAAGCLASIGAREQGAEKVVIVDKGAVVSCGCTGAGQDHFGAQLNTGPEWDSDESATNYYSSPGWGVSRDLVEKSFTREARGMIDRLESWGVEFFRNADGSYYRAAGLGQPEWFLMMKNGKYLKILMAKQLEKAGVVDYGQIVVSKLLKKNGKAIGALGFHRRTGEFYQFRAKSVVLTLGAHQSRWYTNNTNMPYNIWQYPWNTGSQVVLPYNMGAKVKNLERSVLTTLPKGFGTPGVNGFQGMGAFFVNATGERFMENYHRLGDRAPRGALIWGELQEISEGRSPIFLDCTHIPRDELDHLINNLLPVDKHTFTDWLNQKDLDLKTELLEVELGEFSGGGNLHLNGNMESVNVQGLFGLPFSGMLSTAMTGGLVAGQEAAKSALAMQDVERADEDETLEEKEEVFKVQKRKSGYKPKEFETVIRQIMEYYMGPKRSVRGMEIALERLETLQPHLDELYCESTHEVMQAQGVKHLLPYCELSVKAVLMRKGMKGFYTVVDYPPKMDKSLMWKNIVFWRDDDKEFSKYIDFRKDN